MRKQNKYADIDIVGKRFGRLLAVEKIRQSVWLFHCDCGNDVVLKYSRVLGGQQSCGCLRQECMANFGKSHTKHGQHTTKLYRKWNSIKARCYCVSCKQYKRYGGRGITMCDEWHYSFEAFSKWAYANGYDPNKNGRNWSIDRIDNSKGYSPDNCRFATAKEQQINRDITTLYEYKGKQYTASEFADVFNVDKCMVYRRVKQGESLEQILEYWNKAHSVPDGFVDTLEYAKTKGVTRTTVCKWIKQGKLKAERYGRNWYIMAVC